MQVLSNPRKLGSMSGYGLEVTGFIPMPGARRPSADAAIAIALDPTIHAPDAAHSTKH